MATLATTSLAGRLEVLGFVTDKSPRDAAPELSDFARFPKLKELWWFDRYHPLFGLGAVLESPVASRLEGFRAENDSGDVFTLRRNAKGPAVSDARHARQEMGRSARPRARRRAARVARGAARDHDGEGSTPTIRATCSWLSSSG